MNIINIDNKINLYNIYDDKFKTSAISIHIYRKLSKEEASLNALLTNVLARGNNEFNTLDKISTFLENMYGAQMFCKVRKFGDVHEMTFGVQFLNNKYIPKNEDILQKVSKLIADIVFDPYLPNGLFCQEYVDQEKNNLSDSISALINDKRQYAIWRCAELMCADEPFGIHELGDLASIAAITPKTLYEHYKKVISESKMDIFVTGGINAATVAQAIGEHTGKIASIPYPTSEIIYQKNEVKNITETYDVSQGKLTLGFRTGIPPTSEDYFPLIVYNSILGSGAHSKLFANVREKLSLCYYAASKVERYKGILFIYSGIESKNFDKAYDEIFVQMDHIKAGNIEENEFNASIKSIVNAFMQYTDSLGYLEEFYQNQAISNTNLTIEDSIERIKKVTKEDVVRVSQNIMLDTVYFLKGGELA